MQLKESIHKTRNFFHKTLQNLKSLFFGGSQKMPKPLSFKPFSCGSRRDNQTDQYYTDFCNEWECDLEKAMKLRNNKALVSQEEDVSSESSTTLAKKKNEEEKEEKKRKGSNLRKEGEEQCSKDINDAGHALAQKIKELDMVDVSDMEHVLDVEEALHYYSRLKSPVYLDIVDKFFMDMYSEFSVPRASASIDSSKRRLGSIRL